MAFKNISAHGATEISIELIESPTILTLNVSTCGAGVEAPQSEQVASLGRKLVGAMVRQLGADANFH